MQGCTPEWRTNFQREATTSAISWNTVIRDPRILCIPFSKFLDPPLYLACKDRNTFFTPEEHKKYTVWCCQKVCEALIFLLDNINIRFGTKLYRQIVGIPVGTNCAPLVADLFLFCYERDFMMSLSADKDAEIIEAFS